MEPERRLAMLRALKDQVESIYSALPSPRLPRAVKEDGPEPDRTLTLEQRLTRSWCTNLQNLLTDLSQPRYRGQARFAIYREWTLRQLLKGMAEAIERAVREERPPASGTWRALHGLFVFLEGRDELNGPDIPMRYRFHPGTEYKRLLLIGALGEYSNAARILRETGPKLREWGGRFRAAPGPASGWGESSAAPRPERGRPAPAYPALGRSALSGMGPRACPGVQGLCRALPIAPAPSRCRPDPLGGPGLSLSHTARRALARPRPFPGGLPRSIGVFGRPPSAG